MKAGVSCHVRVTGRFWAGNFILRRKCFAQQRRALGDRGSGVLAALVFQRHIAAVAVLSQDPGNAFVVEVERIPGTAAEIGLRLDEEPIRNLRRSFVTGVLLNGRIGVLSSSESYQTRSNSA